MLNHLYCIDYSFQLWGITMPPISGIVTTLATSVAEVIAKMQAIEAALPDTDGLKWFNFLYRPVNEAVQRELGQVTFEDPAWIDRLDVVFANLYFAAVSAAENGGSIPAAWKPLMENRQKSHVARIQFALSGMNAHINRDLVVALLSMFTADGKAPDLNSAKFRDYTKVNDLLKKVEAQVKPTLLVGTPLEHGGSFGPLEDILAMWSVTAARQAAWDHSQALWQLRHLRPIQQASLDALDGLTQLGSAGLSVQVATASAAEVANCDDQSRRERKETAPWH